MLPINLALVSEVAGHDQSDVARVAAALQRQATRDFGPLWEVSATLDAFPRLEDVPVGYWPIIVETDINTPGAAGVHEDKNGQPFALVSMSDSWSLTASHEMLEMLADPFGKRVIPGKSPKEDQGRVEFLVEVCDPCEADQFAYTVNDILVSDFITPHFYDPNASRKRSIQLHRSGQGSARDPARRVHQLARPGLGPLVAADMVRQQQAVQGSRHLRSGGRKSPCLDRRPDPTSRHRPRPGKSQPHTRSRGRSRARDKRILVRARTDLARANRRAQGSMTD